MSHLSLVVTTQTTYSTTILIRNNGPRLLVTLNYLLVQENNWSKISQLSHTCKLPLWGSTAVAI